MLPRFIGRYEIKSELGRGGMAMVYFAYDPRFKRDVAVKVLPREFLHDSDFRARFEREAEIIASLEHPAIVPVYDFGEEEGQPYIVMRFMQNGSLADRLARGTLAPPEAARILDRLAAALDEAHRQGIVHRDLKPANILFDRLGEPHISDFGIAKIAQSTKTLTGSAVIGTPGYISPEQARGEHNIDGRSDVYALGCLLFQMLTGKQPYEGDLVALIYKHVNEPMPSLLGFIPDLPPDCDTVIARATAKDRNERYQRAGELAREFRQAIGGQLNTAQSASGLDADITKIEAGARAVESSAPTARHRGPQTPDSSRSWIVLAALIVIAFASIFLVGGGIIGFSQVAALFKPTPATTSTETPTPTQTLAPGQTPTASPTSTPPPIAISPETAANVTQLQAMNDFTSFLLSIAFSPDRRILALGLYDGTIQLRDADTLDLLRTLEGHLDGVFSLAFNPDGSALISGSGDNTVRLWDVKTGQPLLTLAGHKTRVLGVAFSSDGRTVASGGDDGIVHLMDSDNGLRALTGHKDEVRSVAFSPDGTMLASASRDSTVKLWRVSDGRLLRSLEGHTGEVFSVAFSPDGSRVAAGNGDKTAQLWEVETGKLVRTFEGHEGAVSYVAFSPDGHMLATGSYDHTARLWDVDGGDLLAGLVGHSDWIRGIAFNPQGTGLATVSLDKTLILWGVKP